MTLLCELAEQGHYVRPCEEVLLPAGPGFCTLVLLALPGGPCCECETGIL